MFFSNFAHYSISQGTFTVGDEKSSPEGVKTIVVELTKDDVSVGVEVAEFDIKACGEVETTTALPSGTTITTRLAPGVTTTAEEEGLDNLEDRKINIIANLQSQLIIYH